LQSIALWLTPRWQICSIACRSQWWQLCAFTIFYGQHGQCPVRVGLIETIPFALPSLQFKGSPVLSLSARHSRRATMLRMIFNHHRTPDCAHLILFVSIPICTLHRVPVLLAFCQFIILYVCAFCFFNCKLI
jgi:hypothetical protein